MIEPAIGAPIRARKAFPLTDTAIPADAPIPVFVPYLGPEVHQAASDALTAGWLGMGPLTQQFEQQIGQFLGLRDRFVVSTNSCTAALHLAGLAAGLGPGDEVVCPSFTYVAGHQAMTQSGADVVLCDIEPETLGVDPASMREMVSERTKALMAVHYAGIPCRIDEINALADEFGLRVIEDAAHAFGSRSNGRPIGSFGDLVCFSYGPVKIITTLEGGAVITPRESEIQPMHEWRLIGVDNDTAARYSRGRAWEYDVTRQGYRQMIAVIGGSETLPSIRLHAALGFAHIGLFPAVGYKFGRWIDSVYMQRALGAGSTNLPKEIGHG